MASTPNLPPEFIARLKAVKAKRPRTVIDYILKHGSISTEQLRELGYEHPPRAARDVREQGIPLVTTRVKSKDGRIIGAYTFGLPEDLRPGLVGRSAISVRFKKLLIAAYGTRCAVDGQHYEERYLQPDHRVPVEVGGDVPDSQRDPGDYQLLCGACNRAKSFSCEHCPNITTRDIDVCNTCYWAHPSNYVHIATEPHRQATVVWTGDEVADYRRLASQARRARKTLTEFVKELIRRSLSLF